MKEENAKPAKLSEYAFAAEECAKAEQALTFLRNVYGTYEFDQNQTCSFLHGYVVAMKRIIRQAEM